MCLRIQDFRDHRQAPLTQTLSTPKHTNPIKQSSRNRKAVIPVRQKNPTRPPKQKLFLSFFSFLLFSSSLQALSPSMLRFFATHGKAHHLVPGPDSVRSVMQMRNSEESSTYPVNPLLSSFVYSSSGNVDLRKRKAGTAREGLV